jgi:hypothetical protein
MARMDQHAAAGMPTEAAGAVKSRLARMLDVVIALARADVRAREILDVDVIAQTGAVGRWVIVAEHLKRRSAGRGVNRARNRVDLR